MFKRFLKNLPAILLESWLGYSFCHFSLQEIQKGNMGMALFLWIMVIMMGFLVGETILIVWRKPPPDPEKKESGESS